MSSLSARATTLVLMAALLSPSEALAEAEEAEQQEPSTVATAARTSTASRYLFAAGGAAALLGLGFGYWAQGESKRAETISSATEASVALQHARQSAASATLLFGLAGLTIVYGLLLELLPQPLADKASLTFHF